MTTRMDDKLFRQGHWYGNVGSRREFASVLAKGYYWTRRI